jgi:hypothetical protein
MLCHMYIQDQVGWQQHPRYPVYHNCFCVRSFGKHHIYFHDAQAAAEAADAENALQLEAARVQQLQEQLAMAAATLQQGLTTASHLSC